MRAGFFETDVTPETSVFLAGNPGRRPSEGVDEPLYLRMVALEDDAGERVVLVTMDLLKFPRDMAWRIKQWAERELGLSSASVIINTSHTHSAPGLFLQKCYPHWPVDPQYLRRLEQAIRDGIAGALADLQQTEIRYGLNQAHFGVSRRLPVGDGSGRYRMARNDDGYYDPEMPVFAFYRDRQAGPVAVLYSYGCHATSKNTLQISSDWPGMGAAGLKAEFGEGFIPMFAQGAAGSVMTRMSYASGAEEYAAYWREVAAQIAGFVRSEAMRSLTLKLRTAQKEFFIPYDMERVLPEEELLEWASPEDTPVPDEVRPANREIMRLWAQDLLENQRLGQVPTAFRMHLTRWQLNDEMQLLGMSGEVTAEVGRAIKGLFPEQKTVFLGYCSYTDAYIPTAAMLPQGSHEALCSIYFHERPAPFVKEIDEIIAREVGG
ncbi:MAG: neutral/alkaline non-lysosomal ceramidase N-terminal domain-containing protein [Armatimonadia bacterium]